MIIEFLIELFKFAGWDRSQKEKKERENREIIDKIIQPLISNLNGLSPKIKNLWEYTNHGMGWGGSGLQLNKII